MPRRAALICLSLVMAMAAKGCKPKDTFVRDKTSKVTGVLTIDGRPEPMVSVRMIRVGEPDESATTSKLLTASGMTDEEGKFVIGTYDKGPEGDGAANGNYVLTFQWGQISLIGGRYEGDKFNGKYADPEKSEFKVEVAGAPIDLGVIDLESVPQKESSGTGATPKLGAISGDDSTAPKAAPTGPRKKKQKDD